MNFSHKLVFAYTLIVVLPLFVIMVTLCGYLYKNRIAELQADCDSFVEKNAEIIFKNIETFNSFEQLLTSNENLTLLLASPERSNQSDLGESQKNSVFRDSLIDTMISETTMLERTLHAVPYIYALRIFCINPLVPERWPIIFQSTRTNLSRLDRWEFNYTADYLGYQKNLQLESVCSTRRFEKNHRTIGYIQIAMKTNDFFPFLFKNTNRYNNDYVFRYATSENQEEAILVPITNAQIQKENPPLSEAMLESFLKKMNRAGQNKKKSSKGQGVLKDGRDVRYASWIRIPDMNVILLHTCSAQSASRELFLLEGGIIFGLMGAVFLLYILVRYMTSRLMARVWLLIGGMKQVQNGNLFAEIQVTGKDEVSEAQQTFNKMTEQLRTQIEQIKYEQQLIADTEMKAMQNQINAHFLYNALETIKMQAVIAGENDIEESINVLGKLMHYCLRWRIHEVTLSQELDYIRSYIYLVNIRNDYVISLETEIQEEYKNVVIAKMSLQPIVENAFFYAVEPVGKDAVLKVYTEDAPDPNRFYLCVRDFGCGISKEKLLALRTYLSDDSYERDSNGSIGLKNIQQRLTTFYGNDFRIVIESEEGKGTLVKIPVSKFGRRKQDD